jgi:predicted transcriptional regulator
LVSGNKFPINESQSAGPEWSFLTKHAQVLLCVARDPEVRLRDVALTVNLTERRVQSILSDLIKSEYIAKAKSGRRNRYEIREHAPYPSIESRTRALGEFVKLLSLSENP